MGMEALERGAGAWGARYSVHPCSLSPSAARHRREPRLQSLPENASGRVFPAREKVVGQAFLPARALRADEAGFEPKAGSSPIGGQGGRPGSLGLQDLLPGWAELERDPRSEAAGPRGAPTLPRGLSRHPLPLSLVFTDYSSVFGNRARENAQQVTGNSGILLALVTSPLNPPSPPSHGRL